MIWRHQNFFLRWTDLYIGFAIWNSITLTLKDQGFLVSEIPGDRSEKGPGEKSPIKNSEIRNFWATQTSYTYKRKLRTIVIQIWNKIRDFCTEIIEKKSISRFSIPKNQDVLSVSAKFLENLSR